MGSIEECAPVAVLHDGKAPPTESHTGLSPVRRPEIALTAIGLAAASKADTAEGERAATIHQDRAWRFIAPWFWSIE